MTTCGRSFAKSAGFDPIELFGARKDDISRRAFLDFRAELARRMQQEWLGELEGLRARKPDLDLVLTHVDDRFDAGMRDAIGADAARVLPMLDSHAFTFLIEDPATVWNLGAQRYQAIAEKYRPLTPHRERLAVDINIVDRYQDVYPTKQQTGTELFELVHSAAANFSRVALYFENSLLTPDLPLLPSASAAVTRIERAGTKLSIDSVGGVGVPWNGRGAGGWTAVAGGGRYDGLAAGGRAYRRAGECAGSGAVAAIEWRVALGARASGRPDRVFVSKRCARDRDLRPAAAPDVGGWGGYSLRNRRVRMRCCCREVNMP